MEAARTVLRRRERTMWPLAGVIWRNVRTAVGQNRRASIVLAGTTVVLGIAPIVKSMLESALLSTFASFASDPAVVGWSELMSSEVRLPGFSEMITGKDGATTAGAVISAGAALAIYVIVTFVVWLVNACSGWAQARIRSRYFVGLQLAGWKSALEVTPDAEARVLEAAASSEGSATAEPAKILEPQAGFFSKAVQDGATAVADTTVDTFGLIQNVVTFVAAVASIRVLGLRVMVAFGAVLCVTLLLTGVEARRLKHRREKHEQQRSSLNARTSDILEHRDLIRAWEQTAITHQRLEVIADRYAKTDAALQTASTRFGEFTRAIYDVGRIAVVAVFAVYVGTTTDSTFDVFFASTLYFRLLGPLQSFVDTIRSWARTRANTAIFSELIRSSDLQSVTEPVDGWSAPTGLGAVELRFDHVTYQYPTSKDPVFAGLSFTLPAGKATLLVGRSGGGKTTIARLAMGFLRPDDGAGTVSIDGVSTALLDPGQILTRVDYVSQKHHAIHGSVRENLFPEAGAEDVQLKARLAKVGLSRLDLDEDASDLSHGQRQRLALARLFTTTPAGLAILDEPVTGVDAFTMIDVYEALREEIANASRTTLIISHRLVFTELVDHVVMLVDDPRTRATRIEEGPTEQMLQPGRPFKALYDQARAELDGTAGVAGARGL